MHKHLLQLTLSVSSQSPIGTCSISLSLMDVEMTIGHNIDAIIQAHALVKIMIFIVVERKHNNWTLFFYINSIGTVGVLVGCFQTHSSHVKSRSHYQFLQSAILLVIVWQLEALLISVVDKILYTRITAMWRRVKDLTVVASCYWNDTKHAFQCVLIIILSDILWHAMASVRPIHLELYT